MGEAIGKVIGFVAPLIGGCILISMATDWKLGCGIALLVVYHKTMEKI